MDPSRLFARVPLGHSVVEYDGARWGVTRAEQVGGRSQRVYAEELGGSGVVSANLYLVGDEPALRPCEMPVERVLDFLARFTAVGAGERDDPRT